MAATLRFRWPRRHRASPLRRHPSPYQPTQTEASPGEANGQPLMRADDGTGASETRSQQCYRPVPPPQSTIEAAAETRSWPSNRPAVARPAVTRIAFFERIWRPYCKLPSCYEYRCCVTGSKKWNEPWGSLTLISSPALSSTAPRVRMVNSVDLIAP